MVIRANYAAGSVTNYYVSRITLASLIFTSNSYNMNGKIDVGISLEKAFPITASKIVYMIGEY